MYSEIAWMSGISELNNCSETTVQGATSKQWSTEANLVTCLVSEHESISVTI